MAFWPCDIAQLLLSGIPEGKPFSRGHYQAAGRAQGKHSNRGSDVDILVRPRNRVVAAVAIPPDIHPVEQLFILTPDRAFSQFAVRRKNVFYIAHRESSKLKYIFVGARLRI